MIMNDIIENKTSIEDHSSLKRFYVFEAKRNLWIMILSFVSLFLVLPFYFYKLIKEYEIFPGTELAHIGNQLDENRAFVLNMLTYDNAGVMPVIGFLAVICALFLFSFLSSRKRTDFYYGQPIRKKDLFWCNYLQGIVNVVVPYVVCTSLVLLIAVVNNCYSRTLLCVLTQQFLFYMLFYLTVYTLTVTACCLSGNIAFAILGTGVLLTYFPMVYVILDTLFEGTLANFYKLLSMIVYLSPLVLVDTSNLRWRIHDYQFGFMHLEVNKVLAMLIFLLIAFVSARYLFQKRDKDSVGKPVVFLLAKKIIKVLLVTLGGLGMTVMAVNAFRFHTFYLITGFTVGVFTSLYVVDCMLELSWTACFSKWKRQWIYLLIPALVTGGAYTLMNTCRYKGFDNIPEYYSIEDAKKDGCVVLESGDVISGLTEWESFVDKVNQKEACKIRLVEQLANPYEYTDLIYENGKITKYESYSRFGTEQNYRYIIKLSGNVLTDDGNGESYILSDIQNFTIQDYKDYERGILDLGKHHIQHIATVVK